MSEKRSEDENDSTEGPGNVSVDEPTDPALSGDEQDEFDRHADEGGGSGPEEAHEG